MNFGFDLDRVFVGYPPLVPPALINWLYRDHKKSELRYRYPKNAFEKTFRKITHHHLLRPKIAKNVAFLKKFHHDHPKDKFFLVTGRYSFLQNHTHEILKRYGLTDFFHEVHINLGDEQPHLFKEKVVRKFHIDTMVDDNLDLLLHLKNTCPKLQCFWLNADQLPIAPKNIVTISSLTELEKNLIHK